MWVGSPIGDSLNITLNRVCSTRQVDRCQVGALGSSPRRAPTLARTQAEVEPPLLPGPFTHMAANELTKPSGLSRVLAGTGSAAGHPQSSHRTDGVKCPGRWDGTGVL